MNSRDSFLYLQLWIFRVVTLILADGSYDPLNKKNRNVELRSGGKKEIATLAHTM